MANLERANLLNYVANQPEVRTRIAPEHLEVDLSNILGHPGTMQFGDEHGLVLFTYLGDGVYEGHYLITNTMTAQAALRLCRRALWTLFTTFGAHAINGATPRGFLGARAMNRALGFQPVGSCTDTQGRPCIKYRLERKQWEVLSAERLALRAPCSVAARKSKPQRPHKG